MSNCPFPLTDSSHRDRAPLDSTSDTFFEQQANNSNTGYQVRFFDLQSEHNKRRAKDNSPFKLPPALDQSRLLGVKEYLMLIHVSAAAVVVLFL